MFGAVPGYTTSAGDLGQYNFAGPPTFPNTSNPGNVIAAMAKDLYMTASGTLRFWTAGIAPTRRFVLSYENVPGFTTNGLNTVQVILYETTGVVDIQITQSTGTGNRTVGLQDATKTIGAVAPGRDAFGGTISNEAWRFSPPAAYTYVWSPAAGLSSTTTGTTTLSYSAPGTYDKSLVVTNPITGCQLSAFLPITINPTPAAPTITGPTSVCGAASVTLTSSAPTGTNTINWYNDPTAGLLLASNSQTLATPSIQTSTTFYATQTATTGYECAHTIHRFLESKSINFKCVGSSF